MHVRYFFKIIAKNSALSRYSPLLDIYLTIRQRGQVISLF